MGWSNQQLGHISGCIDQIIEHDPIGDPAIMRVKTIAHLILVAMFFGSGAHAREQITIGITQYPSTLHPSIDSMMAKSYVHGLTHRPITRDGADWQSQCYLCVKLPSIEDGDAVVVEHEDGTRGVKLTYQLHPDAVWGDGTPLTTKDVLFTHEVGRHPLSGVGSAELYRRILNIEVLDDKTFVLDVEKLTFEYASIDDFRLLPEHLEREIFESDPAAYRNLTNYEINPSNPGLWLGPYRVSEVSAGSYILVERNPNWWGKRAPFDRIVIRTIEDTSALEANLRSGEIDMIDGALGLTLDQGLAFEKRNAELFQIIFKSGLVYEHIDLMLDNPIIADSKVRQALVLSIDRELMNDRLFAGRQPVAHSSVNPLDWVFDENVVSYSYDPDAAAKLLDEAGWTELNDGIRHNQDGQRLQLEFMSTAGNTTRERVQQVLQDMWKKVGIDVTIRNEPARVFFGETVSKRQFEAMAMFAWISAPENVPRSTLHSEEIPSPQNGWSGQNYTGYINPQMDSLIDAIEIELDREVRKELWSELQNIYAQDLPAIPLYFRAETHIWPKWLQNVTPTGHLAPVTLHVEDWQISE